MSKSNSARAEALAVRLEQGAANLATLAKSMTDAEWRMQGSKDKRPAGVLVDHVATMYPIEIQLAEALGAGKNVEGVTWDAVAEINANHAKDNASVTKDAAVAHLMDASAKAAAAIRAMNDAQLDLAGTVSLNSDAPLTCQFFLEDHAVRHSYHHTAAIRRIIGR